MERITVTYLLLGSNLGDRAALLSKARATLAVSAGEIVAASSIYETAAWGLEDQPAYLNQALALRTPLSAQRLLRACQRTEKQAGRVRLERWGSRTLDVDILLYGRQLISFPYLTVPHPRLAERRFALLPLAELVPELKMPGTRQPLAELLAQCPDTLPVQRWEGPA